MCKTRLNDWMSPTFIGRCSLLPMTLWCPLGPSFSNSLVARLNKIFDCTCNRHSRNSYKNHGIKSKQSLNFTLQNLWCFFIWYLLTLGENSFIAERAPQVQLCWQPRASMSGRQGLGLLVFLSSRMSCWGWILLEEDATTSGADGIIFFSQLTED